MFDIGFWELLVIAVVALVVLGPERLPGAMRATARTVRGIKGMASHFQQEVEQQLRVEELQANLKKAEEQSFENLTPEVKSAVDELREAAESVQKPYQKDPP